jgi:hypothetical protein
MNNLRGRDGVYILDSWTVTVLHVSLASLTWILLNAGNFKTLIRIKKQYFFFLFYNFHFNHGLKSCIGINKQSLSWICPSLPTCGRGHFPPLHLFVVLIFSSCKICFFYYYYLTILMILGCDILIIPNIFCAKLKSCCPLLAFEV